MIKDNAKTQKPDPRGCAVRALEWVFSRHKSLDVFLEKDQRFGALPTRDKALSRAIIGSSLRHLGQIDAIIDTFLSRPMPRQAVTARQILRAGAAELLFLRSASHGVVNSFVQMAGNVRVSRPYKGMINALLRRIDREGEELLQTLPLELNIPTWLSENWNKTYGPDTVKQAAIALKEPPLLDLTVFEDIEKWTQLLDGTAIGDQTVRLLHKGRIEELEGYDSGKWIVQDLAASIPVQILNPQAGEEIADICAAPGGKTVQIAVTGAKVTALDNQQARLSRLSQNLERTGQSAEIICADARSWKPEQLFDAILLDAPCSATGIFRPHPDVLYNRREKDLAGFAERQVSLTINASKLLKPQGRLIYCVCSAQSIEAEDVIAEILNKTDLKLDPITTDIPSFAEPFQKDGMIRIPPGALPVEGGLDAFFIAKLRKT
ncbi:MAG: rRNA methyltransferase [Robiginitomaculum sp.]|nr:rRNA methyltransferase [Robiginitomaculum sp.]